MEQFSCKPEIFFGADSLSQLARCPCGKVLVVTDPFFVQSGLAQQVASHLPTKEVTFFSQVSPDPSSQVVAKAVAVMEEVAPQVVVALGGGSPIDCAKAMIFAQGRRPFFIAIPTTSGTGSEVTAFSIISHGGVKHPLVDRDLVPDWAILCDQLIEKLPANLVSDAGFDVLVHDLEAVASTKGNCFTTALASHSFCLTYRHLLSSYRGDLTHRGTIHQAATMAGIAFDQGGLGICHSLSHALGGAFHLPHGRLNAILIPAVIHFNRAPAYDQLAVQCGAGSSARSLAAGLVRLRRNLGLPDKLSQAGISAKEFEEKLPQVARAALDDPCTATNPRQPTLAELEGLLKSVFDPF